MCVCKYMVANVALLLAERWHFVFTVIDLVDPHSSHKPSIPSSHKPSIPSSHKPSIYQNMFHTKSSPSEPAENSCLPSADQVKAVTCAVCAKEVCSFVDGAPLVVGSA